MLRTPEKSRLRVLTLAAVALGAPQLHAQVPVDRSAPPPPKQLSGDLQIGAYEPLGIKGQARLWLTRYTAPAVLMKYDVAFVYGRSEFCGLADRPASRDFYTPRFAIARKSPDASLDVDPTFQIKKVDFCSTEAEKSSEFMILSKDLLGQARPSITINWKSRGSIGGLAVNSVSPLEKTEGSAPAHPTPIETSSLSLNSIYLDVYREALGEKGIQLESQRTNASPVSGSFAAAAWAGAAAVTAAASAPRDPEVTKNYCFIDTGTNEAFCDNNFAKITERVLAAARVRSPKANSHRVVNIDDDQRHAAARYVLKVGSTR
ncbi:MAG: hypothetical protein NW223_15865 [Hyphomicrobiaceae bacterium]|nr:hypothetical protein [Hyphomicrobiaceae bacterium]